MLASFTGSFAAGFRTNIPGSGSTSWYALYGDLGIEVNDDYGSSVAYDNDGNIYMIGSDGNAGLINFLVKYDPQGNMLWQKNFTDTNGYKNAAGVTVDGAGNIYVVINIDDAESAIITAKLDSNANIIWQSTLNGVGYEAGVDIAIDSLGNLYIVGLTSTSGSGSYDVLVAKYNTSGVLQWQRTLGDTGSDSGYSIAVDSTNSVYISGQVFKTSLNLYDVIVAKYNSAGVLQWQRTFHSTSAWTNGRGIAIDQNDNVLISTYDAVNGQISPIVIKLNSLGVLQWQQAIHDDIYSMSGYGITTDDLNNVYILYDGVGQLLSLGIAKYDSSGVLQWQRSFGGSLDDTYQEYYWPGRTIALKGQLYSFVAWTYVPNLSMSNVLIVQLPIDGTGLGTYGDFTYAETNFTTTESSLVDEAGTLVDQVGTLPTGTGELVVSNNDYSSNTISMQ